LAADAARTTQPGKTNGPTVTRLKNSAKEVTIGMNRSAILVLPAGMDYRRDGNA
jgi:hypothetical protein